MHRSSRARLQRQRIRAREGAFGPLYYKPRSLEERLANARERRARDLEEQGDLPTPEVAAARAEAVSRLLPERELFLRIFSGDSPMSRRRAVLAWRRLARTKRDEQARERAASTGQSGDTDVNATFTVPERSDQPAAAPNPVPTMAQPDSCADT